ncbi:glycosylphosphatidylinositol anchor biosynthesis [Malassezia nana]|uniref:Glycosylphosphatidylinositol anchor biosynthesis n=1 Tax=Malassezia nana TaxID=180528 RepID=A0AAF0EIE1_9BASI|nr:glycosylphosphatidylinositol anchor biosynthesis [Malassezia nana]
MPWLRIGLYMQLPCFVYLAVFHTRGQVAVTTYLHRKATSSLNMGTVGFLMPCHSTPWQSHMHYAPWSSGGDEGRAWFLACPPPPRPDLPGYWDQSDFFFADPLQYMTLRFPPLVDLSFPPMESASFSVPYSTGLPQAHAAYDLGWAHPWPSHLVLFSSLLDVRNQTHSMAELLTAQGYRETMRFWNALLHPDTHRRGSVVVWSHYSMGALAS